MSSLREQAEQAQADGERQLLLAVKLNEAADLSEGGAVITAPVTTSKRGRKKGSKNKTPATAGKSTTTAAGRGRRNGPKSMKEVVCQVLKGKKKGLQLSDIVTAVIVSGYETKSKQPVNVVYQAVYKLMKDDKVPDDQRIEKDGNNYRLKAAA